MNRTSSLLVGLILGFAGGTALILGHADNWISLGPFVALLVCGLAATLLFIFSAIDEEG
jgi:hypothetical protein